MDLFEHYLPGFYRPIFEKQLKLKNIDFVVKYFSAFFHEAALVLAGSH